MSADHDSLPAQALALAGSATCPAWLADFRSRTQRALQDAGFPGRKAEAWKYTSLHALTQSAALAAGATVSRATVPADDLPSLDAWRVVFVNGRYDATQTSLPTGGDIVVAPLVSLPDAEHTHARALLALTDTARLPFATLNGAAFADGLLVRVPRGTTAGKPLHVVFHTTGDAPATAQACLLVSVEAQASLTLVEQYTGHGDNLFTNAVTAIDLARDARLVHARLDFGDHRQFHVGSLHLNLQGGARCDAWQLMTGSRLKRNDIACTLNGAGAELALRGAWLVGVDEHADTQARIDHAQPHGTSDQSWKGLVGGNGKAVFNGRIHIHPGAKQTSAELVNNNLLLSADAEVDTKPELEIYNDDVKCSHGATVGQLNETGVFYLQSRGIARPDAELMLALGFVNAMVDDVPVPGLAEWVHSRFGRWFAQRSGRPGGSR